MPNWSDSSEHLRRLLELASASAEELNEERTPVKAVSDELVERKVDAATRKADQTHKFREKFFGTVSWAVLGTLVASVVVMLLYLCSEWGQLDAAVLIAFNSAVVVQVIGLAYIVAKYLFPEGGAE